MFTTRTMMYKQDNVINNAFNDVALQEPSPLKDKSKCIPLVTTFYNNINNKNLAQNIRFRISNV